ncbi:Metallo-dependent phosphatase-like protein [Lipomyces tetrasporus]|uniref:Metallo-dependent phosphatase-like protein n=1 Tax=Lipomyces tetrasporus TaxID=54092 RepID=A0AAD7QMI4_9ASCO|nr:Metallo-dependent phosphatase-like protein [Lipomyces tetrasporus]KAJ8098067.1 Metallo-dependent phosphatase-like protein [Lipomyces tetrasporus]
MKVSIIAVLGFAARCLAALPVIQDYSNPSLNASQLRIAYNGPNGISCGPLCGTAKTDFPFEFAIGTSTTFNSSTNWDNIVYIDNLLPNTNQPTRKTSTSQKTFTLLLQKKPATTLAFRLPLSETWASSLARRQRLRRSQTRSTRSLKTAPISTLSGILVISDTPMTGPRRRQTAFSQTSPGSVAYTDIMNSYYDQFVNVTMNTPYLVGPGNHEAECGVATANPVNCVAGQQNFTSYRHHFAMPTKDQTEGYVQNMWYSWNYGMAHFVQFNTETDFSSAPEHVYSGPFGTSGQQVAWLEADLAAVDRTVTPWRQHQLHGLRRRIREHHGQVQRRRRLGVHYYERDTPIANGVPDPKGLNNPTSPWYITSGAAGNVEGHGKPKSPLPTFVEYVDSTSFGWSIWTFHNSSSLMHQFISSETNEVMDEATLYKDHGLKWYFENEDG